MHGALLLSAFAGLVMDLVQRFESEPDVSCVGCNSPQLSKDTTEGTLVCTMCGYVAENECIEYNGVGIQYVRAQFFSCVFIHLLLFNEYH